METASGECEYIQGEEGKDGVSVRKGEGEKAWSGCEEEGG